MRFFLHICATKRVVFLPFFPCDAELAEETRQEGKIESSIVCLGKDRSLIIGHYGCFDVTLAIIYLKTSKSENVNACYVTGYHFLTTSMSYSFAAVIHQQCCGLLGRARSRRS